jgi:hypothetical protein
MSAEAKAQEWLYHLMNDPCEFEKFRYVDTINEYNNVIAELQKLYDSTPPTNRFIRASCLKGLKSVQKDLAKIQAEYNAFKKYKARTAISK